VDTNDLQRIIADAPEVSDDWRDPLPFDADESAPEAYPVDALPELIRGAVDEVRDFVQAPLALVASCALGAQSLTVQGIADVERAPGLRGPCSLYLLTLGESGERKSAVDTQLLKTVRDYERDETKAREPVCRRYAADLVAWQAAVDGIKNAIRNKKFKTPGDDVDELRDRIRALEDERPVAPMVPSLLLGDMTTAALGRSMTQRWPSAGIVSAEAGLVFGGHAMGRDAILGFVSTINATWDATPHLVGRADRVREYHLDGGQRLTLSLMVQPAVLARWLAESGDLARGSGMLARCLLARPTSTQGTRMYRPAPSTWPGLSRWQDRLRALLGQVRVEDGRLSPECLALSPAARSAWIAYHDAVEAELAPDGECSAIRDVASKTAEQAARVAAVLHVVEHGLDDVCADCFAAGEKIAAWHLMESRRYLGAVEALDADADARRLDAWIIEHGGRVSRRDTQRLGPAPLRTRERLDEALARLADLYRARIEGGDIVANPTLLATRTPLRHATPATVEATA
jgi:putative DNA primase/helicase